MTQGEARSKLRAVTTQGQKKRILKGLEDDVLIGFLIDAAQDANDPKITRYPNEDQDLREIIKEMLVRMDCARILAMKEQEENDRNGG